jgi:transposase
MKKYVVRLNREEREQLRTLISKGKVAARKRKHAEVLIKADESESGPKWIDKRIAESFDVCVRTVETIRQRYVEEGLESALVARKPRRPRRKPVFDGEKEARLIALSCSTPPEGRARWTLRLLADQVVELNIVDEVSHETVRQTLKKMS